MITDKHGDHPQTCCGFATLQQCRQLCHILCPIKPVWPLPANPLQVYRLVCTCGQVRFMVCQMNLKCGLWVCAFARKVNQTIGRL